MSSLRSNGWEVWVLTYTPATANGTYDTNIQSLNTLITSNTSLGYKAIDVYSNFINGSGAVYSGYQQTDLIHLTTLWHSVVYKALNTALYNFTTWNPSDKSSSINLSNSNLTATANGVSGFRWVRSILSKSSGKHYWEYNITTWSGWVSVLSVGLGLSGSTLSNYVWNDSFAWGWYNDWTTSKKVTASNQETFWIAPYAMWNVLWFALDITNWSVEITKNGTSQWIMYWSGSLSWSLFPMISAYNLASVTANFWATAFSYAPPSGYNGWIYTDTYNCFATLPSCYDSSCSLTYWTPTSINQSWTQSGASCGFICINDYSWSDCLTAPSSWSTPITWYFDTPVFVSSWSYNWTMTLNMSQSWHIDDIASIDIWDAFIIDSITPSWDTLVFSLSASWWALSVDCDIYTLTIPWWLIQWNDWSSTNSWSILWSFHVSDCPSSWSGWVDTDLWFTSTWSTYMLSLIHISEPTRPY